MKKSIVIIFLFISLASFAQRITNFDAFIAGNGAAIKFVISKGTSCNGYNILHSLDSINYSAIYNFPGICGNTASDESISYLDTAPDVNKYNYYKIYNILEKLGISSRLLDTRDAKCKV